MHPLHPDAPKTSRRAVATPKFRDIRRTEHILSIEVRDTSGMIVAGHEAVCGRHCSEDSCAKEMYKVSGFEVQEVLGGAKESRFSANQPTLDE